MNENLQIKFWGVRGSHPVAGSRSAEFGGNTACVEVRAGAVTVIFDAGTGIIDLGRELLGRARSAGRPVETALFFSHLHHDHTQGIPFFRPLFVPSSRLHFFGPDGFGQGLKATLEQVMTPPAFPVRLGDTASSKLFYNLRETQTVWLGAGRGSFAEVFDAGECPPESERPPQTVQVRCLRSYAHPGGVVLYRLDWQGQSVVYATDTEGYVNVDRRLADFARSADLLIHDAQYSEEHYCGLLPGTPTTQGWGHSTPRMAGELARAAGVRRLALFHHDPTYDDNAVRNQEAQARIFFSEASAAREGLELSLAQEKQRRLTGSLERNAVQYKSVTGSLPALPGGRA